MKQSLQKHVKDIILEYLQDGVMRNVGEIKLFLEKEDISIEEGSSVLRTALYNLKRENPYLKNPKRGFYYLERTQKESDNQKSDKYDFSDFETIHKATCKKTSLVVSIMADGTVALNSRLLMHFPDKNAEIKIKNDCSQMALLLNGNNKISLGKNGRIKNYDILEKVKRVKKKLPIYYVGNWDDEFGIWIGVLSDNNPNSPKKR